MAQRLLAGEPPRPFAASPTARPPGRYCDFGTADVARPLGSLIVMPMAALVDLDYDLAIEDDVGVWHVLARGRVQRA